MTTLTIKIDERSKKGKAFLEFAKTFFKEGKEVEIVTPVSKNNSTTRDIVYSKEFVAKMKIAEENITNGNLTRINLDDIWGSIL